jgi:hypothetical protein
MYLGAIPLFAWLYTMLPLDFFHGTAMHEPMVAAQANAVSTRLKTAFLEGAEVKSSPRLIRLSVRAETDRVRIIMLFVVPEAADTGNPFLTVAVNLDESSTLSPVGSNFELRDPGWYSQAFFFVKVQAEVIAGPNVDVRPLFPCRELQQNTCLRMTFADYSALRALTETAAGRPSAKEGSYLRMLYFSAVTISTLGYGDIVPLTSRARALVTVEIILGPLLFGLFINSLVKENTTHRRG